MNLRCLDFKLRDCEWSGLSVGKWEGAHELECCEYLAIFVDVMGGTPLNGTWCRSSVCFGSAILALVVDL